MKLYSYIKENILVPRNIEGRKEKLRQYNIQLLSQKVIEGDLRIDDTFEDITDELIKVKEIKGGVWLEIQKGYIPSWLKNVKISGWFTCDNCNLTSLENCPQYIGSSFFCDNNYLTSLEGCPQYVGRNFRCNNNKLISLEGCPKYVGENFYCHNNKEILELPEGVELKGKFYN